MEIRKIHTYTNSVDMQIKSDWRSCRIQHKSCKCIAPVWISRSLSASYGSMESIKVAVQSSKPQLRLLLDRYRHAKPEEFGHCMLPYTRSNLGAGQYKVAIMTDIYRKHTLLFILFQIILLKTFSSSCNIIDGLQRFVVALL